MDISYFKINNKSGYKTNEKWLSKNEPELYNDIIEYSIINKIDLYSFKEKIWFYFNKLIERPKCITCNGEIPFRERFDKPYGDFCSLKCINENKPEMIKRQKNTFNKKYGVDFYPEHKDFIEKRKKTKLLLYNNENFCNTKQTLITKELRYGDSKYVNIEKYKDTCLNKYGVDNYFKTTDFKISQENIFLDKYKNLEIISVDGYYVNIKCSNCDNIFKTTKKLLYERNKCNQVLCTICNTIGQSHRSSHEDEISNFLNEINIEHIKSDRKILKKCEIDIYIPSYKLAIELDGLYWHNELFVDKNYHLNKTNECNSKNIDLIHIFEDEWKNKKEIIKSMIKNRLNLIENKLYARNCFINKITQKVCDEFLEKNHIQGSINSKVRLGLFYNNELVSVMTFSNGGKTDEWELIRYANLIDINVIGGAKKLLTYFKEKFKPNVVIGFSDKRYDNGDLYKNSGFNFINETKPDYCYILNGKRYYKLKYRKSVLISQGYDSNKTEREIMFDRKIYRLYNCGNIRWELKL